MSVIYENAIDEMFAVVNAVVTSSSSAIIGYIPTIFWPNDLIPTQPDLTKFWIFVGQQTTKEKNAALGDTLFRSWGILSISLTCPKRVDSISKGRKLSRVIRDAYRKVSGGNILYFNHRVREETPTDSVQQFSIIIEYQYDTTIT